MANKLTKETLKMLIEEMLDEAKKRRTTTPTTSKKSTKATSAKTPTTSKKSTKATPASTTPVAPVAPPVTPSPTSTPTTAPTTSAKTLPKGVDSLEWDSLKVGQQFDIDKGDLDELKTALGKQFDEYFEEVKPAAKKNENFNRIKNILKENVITVKKPFVDLIKSIDDIGDDDAKLEPDDFAAGNNLLGKTEAEVVEKIFNALEKAGVLKAADITKKDGDSLLEEINNFFKTNPTGSFSYEGVKKNWKLRKGLKTINQLTGPTINAIQKEFVQNIINKSDKNCMEKLITTNLESQYGASKIAIISDAPSFLKTNEVLWGDDLKNTPTSSIILTCLNSDKIFAAENPKFNEWLFKNHKPSASTDLNDNVEKQSNKFFEAYAQSNLKNEVSNYNKLLSATSEYFLIGGFETLLKDTNIPDDVIDKCMHIVNGTTAPSPAPPPAKKASTPKKKSRKPTTESLLREANDNSKYQRLYADSAWAKSKDPGLSRLPDEKKLAYSKSKLSAVTSQNPLLKSPNDVDVFEPVLNPSKGAAVASGAESAVQSATSEESLVAGENFAQLNTSVLTDIGLKMNEILQKISDSFLGKMNVMERLKLVSSFTDYVKNPKPNHEFLKLSQELKLTSYDLINLTYYTSLLIDASKKSDSGNVGSFMEGMLTSMMVAPITGGIADPTTGKAMAADNLAVINNTKTIVYTSLKSYLLGSKTSTSQSWPNVKQVLDKGNSIIYLGFFKEGSAQQYDGISLFIVKIFKTANTAEDEYASVILDKNFEVVANTEQKPVFSMPETKGKNKGLVTTIYPFDKRDGIDDQYWTKTPAMRFLAFNQPGVFVATKAMEVYQANASATGVNQDFFKNVNNMMKASETTVKHLKQMKNSIADMSDPQKFSEFIGTLAIANSPIAQLSTSLAELEDANMSAFFLKRKPTGGYDYDSTKLDNSGIGKTLTDPSSAAPSSVTESKKITARSLKKLIEESFKKNK